MDDLTNGFHRLVSYVSSALGQPTTQYLCAIACRVEVYADAEHDRISEVLFWPLRRRYACDALKWPFRPLETLSVGAHYFDPDMFIEEVAWHVGDLTHADLSYGPRSETYWGLTECLMFDRTTLDLKYRRDARRVDFSLQPVFIVIDAMGGNARIASQTHADKVAWREIELWALDSKHHMRYTDTGFVRDDDMTRLSVASRYDWDIATADPPDEETGCVVTFHSARATTRLAEHV